jgi:hypothetical protein
MQSWSILSGFIDAYLIFTEYTKSKRSLVVCGLVKQLA